MQWIKCSEDLPTDINNVIVALNYGYRCKGTAVGWYAPNQGLWYIDMDDGEYICEKYLDCDVNYWMPLPKYPEE